MKSTKDIIKPLSDGYIINSWNTDIKKHVLVMMDETDFRFNTPKYSDLRGKIVKFAKVKWGQRILGYALTDQDVIYVVYRDWSCNVYIPT